MNYILRTYRLAKRFRFRLRVRDISLSVPEGSIYGFLGPNGAGKSTTIKMILGLIRPTNGHVEILGERLKRKNLAHIGAIVESPRFYDYMSGMDNIRVLSWLSGRVDEKALQDAIDVVGLRKRIHDKVKIYSQGMRQRLAIACSLVPAPKLLILDEPTNGLDPEGVRDMRDLILELNKKWGLTIFLSSHVLSEVEKIADHVAIISDGILLFEGTVNQLQKEHSTNVVKLMTSDNSRARDLLASRMFQVIPPPATRDDERFIFIDFTPQPGRGDVHEFAMEISSVLAGAGLTIGELSTEKPDLESIFLRYTGT
ncbi:MAG: ATP-binding cassette domain-containing protein [Planctomycetes bacterium]|nr:ATP-binding cassette domain-containing protein [Planctomycetota bacterium]